MEDLEKELEQESKKEKTQYLPLRYVIPFLGLFRGFTESPECLNDEEMVKSWAGIHACWTLLAGAGAVASLPYVANGIESIINYF